MPEKEKLTKGAGKVRWAGDKTVGLGHSFSEEWSRHPAPHSWEGCGGTDQGEATERGSREPLVTSRQTCLQLSGVQCELSTQTQPGHAVPSEVALRERQKDWLGLGVRDVAFFF